MKCWYIILLVICSHISSSYQTSVAFSSTTGGDNKTLPLYFGLMLSLSGDHQSTGALAGVQAALDDINRRDDLLPGYSLHYTLTDSQVSIVYCDHNPVYMNGAFSSNQLLLKYTV